VQCNGEGEPAVSLQDTFLKALAENEDDIATRLVYADWLDEQGEHEESDRQRKWPAAKDWLVRFCKENLGYHELAYEQLIEFGRRVAKEGSTSERVYVDNEDMWYALRDKSLEYWANWSVVTSLPFPPGLESKGFHHWQCCPTENYYWFREPDANESEE
jgi:uncharacterized protein (TIGR02996 family)